MPAQWIYYIAVAMILVIRILMVDTSYFAEWVWYNGDEQFYYALMDLRDNSQFLSFAGGWPIPVFVLTVFAYWITDEDEKDIGKQFLLLPLAYVPFSIIGHVLAQQFGGLTDLYTHPLVIVPIGYLYIFPWVLFVKVFCKLKLLVE